MTETRSTTGGLSGAHARPEVSGARLPLRVRERSRSHPRASASTDGPTLFAVGVRIVPLVAVAFAAFVVSRPSIVARHETISIRAPVHSTIAEIEDLRRWTAWSPWGSDPVVALTFAGPSLGQGAALHWANDDNVGPGHLVISESVPGQRVELELTVTSPWRATRTMTLSASRVSELETELMWDLSGRRSVIDKALAIVTDGDDVIDEAFRDALKRLKVVAEMEALRVHARASEMPVEPTRVETINTPEIGPTSPSGPSELGPE